ncbi:MAG: helix-turn-helix transcriptional regulator [Thermodesulfobacteriota bacterium]
MENTNPNDTVFRQIKSDFALRGLTFANIADQLGCTRSMITQVAKGKAKSSRVREFIATTLGRDPWADND